MRLFIVAASLWMLIGEIKCQSYGAPGGTGGYSGGGGSSQSYGAPAGGQVHKHIYVHVAPDFPIERTVRPYKPHPPPEKHYKILFIKAPTPPPQEQQEIELPPQPEQKTLVYVLIRKPTPAPEARIIPAPPTKPSKPEVYFIRYKNKESEGYGAPPAGQYGSPAAPAPSGQYGSPAAPAPGGQYGAPF